MRLQKYLALLLFLPSVVLADNLTVKNQLIQLNKYWNSVEINNDQLQSRVRLQTDIELIQTHLYFVEEHLRAKETNHLSVEQKENRAQCLNYLNEYRLNGVFPKNLYHKERTPYFIDDFGTACAVGQLVISSGYSELAIKISKENNYEYIENMDYPELVDWAKTHGFTIDELKWIQPTYGPCGSFNHRCSDGLKRDITCFDGSDGCIGFNYQNLPNPGYYYEFNWYEYDSISLSWNRIYSPCGVPAGLYKTEAIDIVTIDTIYILTELNQPPKLKASIYLQEDIICGGDCTGKVVLTPSGGTSPYYIQWSNGDSGIALNNICSGNYTATITDNVACNDTTFFNVNISAPPILMVNIDTVSTENDKVCNGEATIIPYGGVPPYSYSWDILSDTSNFVSNLCDTTYRVTITDNNNCYRTEFFKIKATKKIPLETRVSELGNLSISLFPNPASNMIYLNIDNQNIQNLKFQILDMKGQLIMKGNLNKMEIDISTLNSGVHFIQLVDDQKIYNSRRFIKS